MKRDQAAGDETAREQPAGDEAASVPVREPAAASLPQIYLARHGETAWTISGQHTSRTDLPLTARGEHNARALARRLKGVAFSHVLSSPYQRARRTCELSGYGAAPTERDLSEWDYGDYEGRTTAEIRRERLDWDLFRDGCPGGESPHQVAARADRVIALIREVAGTGPGGGGGSRILLFGHGHFFRVLAARWIGLPACEAHHLALSTAALSILGYEHSLAEPAILLWNDCRHVRTGRLARLRLK